MALPTREKLLSLEVIRNGVPFVNLAAKQMTTEFFHEGAPFYTPSTTGSGPVTPPVAVFNAAQFFIMF